MYNCGELRLKLHFTNPPVDKKIKIKVSALPPFGSVVDDEDDDGEPHPDDQPLVQPDHLDGDELRAMRSKRR